VLSIVTLLLLCALPQVIIEPAPVVGGEQQLAELISKATSAGAAASLHAELRQLNAEWPVLPTRLLEATLLEQPANNSKIAAAIRLTGELGVPQEDLLQRLVVLLDSRQFATVSREALATICGREFSDGDDFRDWYKDAAGQNREQWLETTLREQWHQEEQLWKQRLLASPSAAVITLAMQHQRRAVRELAFASLAKLKFENTDEATRALIVTAFRKSIESERDLQLRIQLLQQVPRFIHDRDALTILVRAIEQGKPNEATEASRQLAFLTPSSFAWQALLRELDGSYAASSDTPAKIVTTTATRLALWTGLSSLAVRPESISQGQIDLLLQRGLSQEQDLTVLEKIFVCTGRQAGIEFLPILEAIVLDEEQNALRRSAALLSITSVATRGPDPSILSKLVIGLLDDPEKQVRGQAISSLRRLNPEGAFDVLANRLSQETQVVLQKEILSALALQRSPIIVNKLLEFVPTVELNEAYLRALSFQIDGSIELLQRAVSTLQPRQSHQAALLLVGAFPLQNISDEGVAQLNELHAMVLSEQLMQQGDIADNILVSDDALLRLHDLQQLNPEEGKWLDYELKLRLLRNEISVCIEQLPLLAKSNATHIAKWTLAIDVMAASTKLEIADSINTIRVIMQAAGPLPPELEFRASQLFDIDTSPLLPEPLLPLPVVVEVEDTEPGPDPLPETDADLEPELESEPEQTIFE
jgi:hypothetical protein